MKASKLVAILLGILMFIFVVMSVVGLTLFTTVENKRIVHAPHMPRGSSQHHPVDKIAGPVHLQKPTLNTVSTWSGDFFYTKNSGMDLFEDTVNSVYVCGWSKEPDNKDKKNGEVVNQATGKPIPHQTGDCEKITYHGVSKKCDKCQLGGGMFLYNWGLGGPQPYYYYSVPKGFGWSSIPPEGRQVLVSTEAGFNVFAQLTLNLEGNLTYEADKNLGGNRVVDSKGNLEDGISAYGCVGKRSFAHSVDGLRTYVAYASNKTGNDYLAFRGLSYEIAGFTRPVNHTGPLPNDSYSTSTAFAFSDALRITNPFGAKAIKWKKLKDRYGREIEQGKIGSILRTTVNPTNGNRVLATRMQSGYFGRPAVIFYEEKGTGMELASTIEPVDGNLDFASDFALAPNMLVVYTPGKVDWYQYKEVSGKWDHGGVIAPPSADDDDFGASLEMSPDGLTLLVTSPSTTPGQTPKAGGNAYLFQFDGSNWHQTDKIGDTYNFKGAFGFYTSVDANFTVCTISANTDNSRSLFKTTRRTGADPRNSDDVAGHIAVYAIDRTKGKFVAPSREKGRDISIRQNGSTGYVVDRVFGAGVSIQRNRDENTYVLSAPEMINKIVSVYTIHFKK